MSIEHQPSHLQQSGLFSRKPKPEHLVTIIIGMTCEDGIVLAADSQRTEENGIKDSYTRKITPIRMADVSAMIAQIGHADLASRTVEILKRKAAGKIMNHSRTLADLAEESLGELRQQLRNQGHELGRFFQDYTFELLIAHYFRGSPHLFLMKAEVGLAIVQQKRIVAVGCGSPMANVLLDPFRFNKMRVGQALTAATYIIEKVKEFDSRCGGPVVAGFIVMGEPNLPTLVRPSFIKRTVEHLKTFDEARTASWMKELVPLLDKIVAATTLPEPADVEDARDDDWEPDSLQEENQNRN